MEQEVFDSLYSLYKSFYLNSTSKKLKSGFILRGIQTEILKYSPEAKYKWMFDNPVYVNFSTSFINRKDYADFMQVVWYETACWVYKEPDVAFLHFNNHSDLGRFKDEIIRIIEEAIPTYKEKMIRYRREFERSDVDDLLAHHNNPVTSIADTIPEEDDPESLIRAKYRKETTPVFDSKEFLAKKIDLLDTSPTDILTIPRTLPPPPTPQAINVTKNQPSSVKKIVAGRMFTIHDDEVSDILMDNVSIVESTI